MIEELRQKLSNLIQPKKKSFIPPGSISPTFKSIDGIFQSRDHDLMKYRSVVEQIATWEFLAIPYRVISDTAARIVDFPLILTQDKKRIDSHPVLEMMKIPNDSGQTFDQIRFELWSFFFITGNSYLYVPRGIGTGDPIGEMWVRYPQFTQPRVVERRKIFDYTGNEETFFGPQGYMQIPGEEMIHHKTFNPHSQLTGISPLQHGAHSIEMQKAAMRWNVETTRRAMKVPGIISTKRMPPDEGMAKWMRDDFRKNFHGNPGEPFLSFLDMDYTPIEFKGNDIDFIKGRQMDTRDICGLYGYPYKLAVPNDTASLSENEMSAMYEQWYNGVIIPLLKTECKLFSMFFFPDGDIEFWPDYMASPQYRDIVTGNLERLDKITSITPNEKRKMAGLEELPMPEADKLYMPAGMSPIDELGLDIPAEEEDREGL